MMRAVQVAAAGAALLVHVGGVRVGGQPDPSLGFDAGSADAAELQDDTLVGAEPPTGTGGDFLDADGDSTEQMEVPTGTEQWSEGEDQLDATQGPESDSDMFASAGMPGDEMNAPNEMRDPPMMDSPMGPPPMMDWSAQPPPMMPPPMPRNGPPMKPMPPPRPVDPGPAPTENLRPVPTAANKGIEAVQAMVGKLERMMLFIENEKFPLCEQKPDIETCAMKPHCVWKPGPRPAKDGGKGKGKDGKGKDGKGKMSLLDGEEDDSGSEEEDVPPFMKGFSKNMQAMGQNFQQGMQTTFQSGRDFMMRGRDVMMRPFMGVGGHCADKKMPPPPMGKGKDGKGKDGKGKGKVLP